MLLLPRISRTTALQVISNYQRSGIPVSIEARRANVSGSIFYAASGGTRSPFVFDGLREQAERLASDFNFPAKLSEANAREFDCELAKILGVMPELTTGEGLRDEVWSYVSIVELARLINWRFPGAKPFRYLGGVRNAIQRLWLRSIAMDRGENSTDRWEIVEALNESLASQVLDRTSLARDQALTLAIGESWLKLRRDQKIKNLDLITKRASVRILMKNEVVYFGALSPEARIAITDEIFMESVNALASR